MRYPIMLLRKVGMVTQLLWGKAAERFAHSGFLHHFPPQNIPGEEQNFFQFSADIGGNCQLRQQNFCL